MPLSPELVYPVTIKLCQGEVWFCFFPGCVYVVLASRYPCQDGGLVPVGAQWFVLARKCLYELLLLLHYIIKYMGSIEDPFLHCFWKILWNWQFFPTVQLNDFFFVNNFLRMDFVSLGKCPWLVKADGGRNLTLRFFRKWVIPWRQYSVYYLGILLKFIWLAHTRYKYG